MFDTFDTDHDGSISEPEIKAALAKVGITDAEVASLLKQYDTNKCGLAPARWPAARPSLSQRQRCGCAGTGASTWPSLRP